MRHGWAVSFWGRDCSVVVLGSWVWCVQSEQALLRNPFQVHFSMTFMPPPQPPSLSSRLITRVAVPEA